MKNIFVIAFFVLSNILLSHAQGIIDPTPARAQCPGVPITYTVSYGTLNTTDNCLFFWEVVNGDILGGNNPQNGNSTLSTFATQIQVIWDDLEGEKVELF